MPFVTTTLTGSGKKIAVNVAHIENVYDAGRGQSTIVMLPVGDRSNRVFETQDSFGELTDALNEIK